MNLFRYFNVSPSPQIQLELVTKGSQMVLDENQVITLGDMFLDSDTLHISEPSEEQRVPLWI